MSQTIFKNGQVDLIPSLTPESVGNGTLTVNKLSHFTIAQSYTAICTAIDPFTVFNIIGSLDGAVGVAVVGEEFHDEDAKIFLTIQQGPIVFEIGDTFEFSVIQGTDLNQENIDLYDELPQKNFGAGIIGEHKGDHNLRFSQDVKKASLQVGDLLFKAKESGTFGNRISIEYLAGTILAPASRNIQDLKFTSNQYGEIGNSISIKYTDTIQPTNAEKIIGDLKYTAIVAGANGNTIGIEYVTGGVVGFESVSVLGGIITITIDDGYSTVGDIKTAIDNHSTANQIVNVDVLGNALTQQSVVPLTYLENGADAIGDVGEAVVVVNGNQIEVIFASLSTTAQEIRDLVNNDPSASSLVTLTYLGPGTNLQEATGVESFLIGGTENFANPTQEFITLNEEFIQVAFVSEAFTSQELKDFLLLNPKVDQLIEIELLDDGSTPQLSGVERTYLSGGVVGDTYSFNKRELTEPNDFYEGNADILANNVTSQGQIVGVKGGKFAGSVILDDQNVENKSGPEVANLQKFLNDLDQNDKLILLTQDNEKVDWRNEELSFITDILIVMPDTGVVNKITTANSPIYIPEGKHIYVLLKRFTPDAELTLYMDDYVPKGPDTFRLVSRVGADLIWWNNGLQKDKKKARIGEGGGGGGNGLHEHLGYGNDLNNTFPLTFLPTNAESILVFVDGLQVDRNEWEFEAPNLTFVSGFEPRIGQSVYAWYLTEGEALTIEKPEGVQFLFYHTISAVEHSNKEFILPSIPYDPLKVMVDIINGPSQQIGLDFQISGNILSWSGMGLDGILETNDVIRLFYFN